VFLWNGNDNLLPLCQFSQQESSNTPKQIFKKECLLFMLI
jgi:hypothetical protein